MTQRTDSGRVMTQSELIANDIEPILGHDHHKRLGGKPCPMANELTRYVLEQRGEDFFNGEKVGRLQGHKEAGVMFLSAFDAELNKVLDGALPAWADETLDMAKRAVAAISKSTEAKG